MAISFLSGSLFGGEGKAPFTVMGPENPHPWEETAVQELSNYLNRVVADGMLTVDGSDAAVFHVGNTSFAAQKGLSSASLSNEEWVVRSFGCDVILNGGGTRGCLYAVYHFLEDFCGVHWWMDGDEDLPAAKALELPSLDRRGKPHFLYRDIYRSKKDDFRTAIRNHLNGNGDSRIAAAFGGGETFGPPYHCHTWRFHVPWEKFGKDHPEYFALLDGKRTGGKRAQLCLSNPDLPAVMAASVERWIAKGEAEAKKLGLPPPRLYDMSMNDVRNKSCQCDACRALQEKYGFSGYQLLFENKVAGLLGAKHPDLLFSVFAYFESEAVPKGGVRAADNLVVKLCNTTQNMAAGIGEPDNRFMYDQVAAWKNYAKNLFIWEYAITFEKATRGLPFANELHFADKLRYYAANGVIGLLIEQEVPERGDLYELKYHLLARLLEDPTRDADRLTEDFMRNYYGAAGAKILASRRHLDRIRRERNAFVTWCPRYVEFAYVDEADIVLMKRLWDEAETAVADDSKRLKRVRRSREGFDRLCKVKEAFFKCRRAAEPGLSEKPFVDCPASAETYLLSGDNVSIVDDPEASTGKAIRYVFKKGESGFPFVMGVYSQPTRRKIAARTWKKPLGDGYRWYELKDVDFPSVAYVYLTRGWSIQIGPSLPEIMNRRLTVKVRAKFTDDALYVDRTVFVPSWRPVVAVQTQFYPHREWAKGYLGRYVNQPLFVEPGDPNDVTHAAGWGKFHGQDGFEATLRAVRSYGIDGVALFASRSPAFFEAAKRASVPDLKILPIVGFWEKNVTNEFAAIERVLASPSPWKIGERYVVPSYWTSANNTPDGLRAKYAAVRAKYGDRFLFLCQILELCGEIDAIAAAGGKVTPKIRARMEEKVRRWARVADGIEITGLGGLSTNEKSERVFAADFVRLLHEVVRKVLDEPEFRGRKLFSTSAIVAHMNAYRHGCEVSEDCTRTLRTSLQIALENRPDYIFLPEWDEYNENTCFGPTLYGGFTVKRIVRSMLAETRGDALTPLEGDDLTLPNLIVSYRKAVSPGERLTVEVLSVPDGSRSGSLDVAVSVSDEQGRIIRTFPRQALDESRLDEIRLDLDTAELAARTHALQIGLKLFKDGRCCAEVGTGLHPIDLKPANSWNHLCVRQPIREIARFSKADVAFADGRIKADFACDEPIRCAMLCGNGAIQAIRGAPAPVDRFREDERMAVFRLDVFSPTTRRAAGDDYRVFCCGVDGVEWFYDGRTSKGTSFSLPCLGPGGEPSLYLRLDKAKLKEASLRIDFRNVLSESVSLDRVFALGAYGCGTVGNAAQVTVTRFGLQGLYPPPLDGRDCSFSLLTDADRKAMTYHVQVVTMTGRRWFSRPFVVNRGESASRKYDFSPTAGNVVRVMSGERHWFGMLGGPHPLATLWNRGGMTAAAIPQHRRAWSHVNRPDGCASPKRIREPDGTWSLELDGVDDYVSFPWETVPAFGGATVSLEVWPYDANTNSCILASKGTVRLMNGDMGIRPGRWNAVKIRSTRQPAPETSCLSVGVDAFMSRSSDFFRGKIRNLEISLDKE